MSITFYKLKIETESQSTRLPTPDRSSALTSAAVLFPGPGYRVLPKIVNTVL